MPTQTFSAQNMLRSSFHLERKHSAARLRKAAKLSANAIAEGRWVWPEVKSGLANGKKTYFFSSLDAQLVANRISDNLKYAYRVFPPDRQLVVRQLEMLLREAVPFSVLRLDISKFFESVDVSALLSKLDRDMIATTETRELLASFLQHVYDEVGVAGLPRGFPVSSVLSELVLSEFDSSMRRRVGVYYYTRFVDDIVVFCSKEPTQTKAIAARTLKDYGLKLSPTKYHRIDVECAASASSAPSAISKCFPTCKCPENEAPPATLSYLGYTFAFATVPNSANQKKGKSLTISLSRNKVKKIKTRIIESLNDYFSTSDYQLLLDRIKFLTGNYIVSKSDSGSVLLNGNSFNYQNVTDLKSFDELDRFKAKVIFSRTGPIGLKIGFSPMTLAQKRNIAKVSFRHGFRSKLIHRFTPSRVEEITSAFRQ